MTTWSSINHRVVVWVPEPEKLQTANIITPQVRTPTDPDQSKYTDYSVEFWEKEGKLPLRFRAGDSSTKPTTSGLIQYWLDPFDWGHYGIAIDEIDPDDHPVFAALSGLQKPSTGFVAAWHKGDMTDETAATYAHMSGNLDYILLQRYHNNINQTALIRLANDAIKLQQYNVPIEKAVVVLGSKSAEPWITDAEDLEAQVSTVKTERPEFKGIGLFGGSNVASGPPSGVLAAWDKVIQKYYPTMLGMEPSGQIEENFNYALSTDMHNVSGWSVYNEDGQRPTGYDSILIHSHSGAVVAGRVNPGTSSDDRYANMKSDEIIPASAFNKVTISGTLYLNNDGRISLMLRPSGTTNDAFSGYRMMWRRRGGQGDQFHLYEVTNGNATKVSSHTPPESEIFMVTIEDDKNSIKVTYVTADGSGTVAHDYSTSKFVEHGYRAFVQMKAEGGHTEQFIDNYSLKTDDEGELIPVRDRMIPVIFKPVNDDVKFSV